MLKRERVKRQRYQSLTEARANLFDYIERFVSNGMDSSSPYVHEVE